jgi:hypothetical protein
MYIYIYVYIYMYIYIYVYDGKYLSKLGESLCPESNEGLVGRHALVNGSLESADQIRHGLNGRDVDILSRAMNVVCM